MVTDIIIPVRDQLELTQQIVQQLEHMTGWDHCWILDNGSVDDTWEWLTNEGLSSHFTPISTTEWTIYEMWDWGFDRSYHSDSDNVLFLNNDVKLHPATITALNNALNSSDDIWIAYPDYNASSPYGQFCNYRCTKGTYRHGGMSGFCFMLKTKKVDWSPLVDPQFIWWGGDDDIAFNVEARGGRQVRVVGLPIEHMNEGTARHHDLGAQKAADLKAVIEKWGR